jgi:hypothetical protein
MEATRFNKPLVGLVPKVRHSKKEHVADQTPFISVTILSILGGLSTV